MARRGVLYILQHLEADHVPLHYVLLGGWGELAGWSELSVRFLSVCAAVLTIPLLYQVVLSVTPRRLPAMVGAAVLAVAPFHVYYAQETRMYALAVLFLTLAAYAALRAWQLGSNALWGLYAVSASAALYTFYYSGLALVGLNLAFVLARRRPRGWWVANGAAMLSLLPWLGLVAGRFARFLGNRVALAGPEPFGPMDIVQSPAYLAFGSTLDMGWALGPGLLLALLGLTCVLLQVNRGGLPAWVLAGWALGTVVCLDLLQIKLPIYDARYLIVSLPGWIAVVVVTFGRDDWLLRRVAIPATVLFLALASVSLFNNYFNGVYQRPDYRDTFAKVRSQASPDDLLIYDTPFQPWAPDYYFRDKPIPAIGLPEVRAKDGGPVDLAELSGYADWAATEQELAAAATVRDGIWLLLFGQPHLDPDNRVEGWLDQHRLAVSDEWINGVRLKHYLPAPQPLGQALLPGGERLGQRIGQLELLAVKVGQQANNRRVPVRLLWTARDPVGARLSVSLQLFDPSGHRVAQHDGPIMWGALAPGEWRTETAYFDSAALDVPTSLPAGLYELRLSVYDQERQPVGDQRRIGALALVSGASELRPGAATSAGWRLESVQVGRDAGGRLLVALASQVISPPATDYTWFVHVLDSRGMLAGQEDHPPLIPTSAWRPGEQHVDWFSPNAQAGAQLEIGAYDRSGRRVAFDWPDGRTADHVTLALPT